MRPIRHRLSAVRATALLVALLAWWQVGGSVLAGPAAPAAVTLFPPADNVLAVFEFEGNANDSSGNNRSGTLLGGAIVPNDCGSGLQIADNAHGLDWSAHAALLVHPYTIEMILTPEQTTSYAKLFSHDDTQEAGWYYGSNKIELFPWELLGTDNVLPGVRHYLAFVSTGPDTVHVYFQGNLLGSGSATFTAPPVNAVFFRDDAATSRFESLRGIVDALRISSVTRTPAEIGAVMTRVLACQAHSAYLPALMRQPRVESR